MLVLSRKVEETIHIGDNIEIKLLDILSGERSLGKNAKAVSIGITAPKEIAIVRKELIQIAELNIEAEKSAKNIVAANLSAALKNRKLDAEHNQK